MADAIMADVYVGADLDALLPVPDHFQRQLSPDDVEVPRAQCFGGVMSRNYVMGWGRSCEKRSSTSTWTGRCPLIARSWELYLRQWEKL